MAEEKAKAPLPKERGAFVVSKMWLSHLGYDLGFPA